MEDIKKIAELEQRVRILEQQSARVVANNLIANKAIDIFDRYREAVNNIISGKDSLDVLDIKRLELFEELMRYVGIMR